MLGGVFFRDFERVISRLKKDIKLSFSSVKNELDEHLDSINSNTNEIQSNYEYICELESKIEKLNEKIEDLEMFLRSDQSHLPQKQLFNVRPLTRKEQEIFFAVYTLEQGADPVTYSKIAQFLGLSQYVVQEYITSLISKGIPIHKNMSENIVYLRLNPEFREIQAKRNIAGIQATVSKKISEL